MKKIFFALALFLGFIVMMPLYCQTIAIPPSNYDDPDAGTESNPYLISNLANLRWLSEESDDWWQGSTTSVKILLLK